MAGGNGTTQGVSVGAFDNIYYTSPTSSTPFGHMYVCNTGDHVHLETITIATTGAMSLTTDQDGGMSSGACSPTTEIANTIATTVTTASVSNTGSTATISVTSGSGTNFTNGDYIEIDSELMLINAAPTSTTLSVNRAQGGTTEAAHSSGATVNEIVDKIFFGFTATSTITNCSETSGGVCVATVSSGAAAYNTAAVAASGVGGIVIDNTFIGTPTGTEQIYYSILGATATCTGAGGVGSGTGGCAIQASQANLSQ